MLHVRKAGAIRTGVPIDAMRRLRFGHVGPQGSHVIPAYQVTLHWLGMD